MYLYLPQKKRLFSADIGYYTTYGIRVWDEVGKLYATVSDVSTDETFVCTQCREFTKEQLEPIHLADVLDDIL